MNMHQVFACLMISTIMTTGTNFACHPCKEDQIDQTAAHMYACITALEQAQTVAEAHKITECLCAETLRFTQLCDYTKETVTIATRLTDHVKKLCAKKILLLSTKAGHDTSNNYFFKCEAIMAQACINRLQLGDLPENCEQLTHDIDSYYVI